MKLFFPILLAVVWIALVAMTLTDFAGFASATRPCVAAVSATAGQQQVALALNGRAKTAAACP
jgi:hypothetical protein